MAISLGYFIFSKNHQEPPKVAQLAKKISIWSPWSISQGISWLSWSNVSKLICMTVQFKVTVTTKHEWECHSRVSYWDGIRWNGTITEINETRFFYKNLINFCSWMANENKLYQSLTGMNKISCSFSVIYLFETSLNLV